MLFVTETDWSLVLIGNSSLAPLLQQTKLTSRTRCVVGVSLGVWLFLVSHFTRRCGLLRMILNRVVLGCLSAGSAATLSNVSQTYAYEIENHQRPEHQHHVDWVDRGSDGSSNDSHDNHSQAPIVA